MYDIPKKIARIHPNAGAQQQEIQQPKLAKRIEEIDVSNILQ
jgi:hypothetical protein